MQHNFSLFKKRREQLIATIKSEHPHVQGAVILVAGFESDRYRFLQESSFYYYTGLKEPGAVAVFDLNGTASFYIPHCGDVREKWIHEPVALDPDTAKRFQVDTITALGSQLSGYQSYPFFNKNSYSFLLQKIESILSSQGTIFTLYPDNEHEYIEQRFVIERLIRFIPSLSSHIVDISAEIAVMRRTKDSLEIDNLIKAIETTVLAHEAAARVIKPGSLEAEVQASLEYIMTGSGSCPAFPSIVAAGKNGTVLHYTENNAELKKGELVVVDIGARYEGYCADITRTYPVSGKFTPRQRELYTIVLDVQQYIADNAQPGMYLKNKDHSHISLHHMAVNYLKKYSLDRYLIHGIGHYLGLDVHDVGSYATPLQKNDIFTIEPGLYIPEEGIGIRIEDDYWMAKGGAVCLSEQLSKDPDSVERMVQRDFEHEDNQIDMFSSDHLEIN